MESEIDLSMIFGKEDQVLETNVDGKTILLSMVSGNYIEFNATSSAIWTLIDGNRDVSQIVAEIDVKYDVEREKCIEDVYSFLRKLRQEEVVTLA